MSIIVFIASAIYGIVVIYNINLNRIMSLYTSIHPVIGGITTFLTATDLAVLIVLVAGGLCGIGPLILFLMVMTVPFFMALNKPLTLGEAIILFDDDFWNW